MWTLYSTLLFPLAYETGRFFSVYVVICYDHKLNYASLADLSCNILVQLSFCDASTEALFFSVNVHFSLSPARVGGTTGSAMYSSGLAERILSFLSYHSCHLLF